MKRIILFILFAVSIIEASNKSSMAVLNFECPYNPDLGWRVAEIIRTELIDAGNYNIVSRILIEDILNKKELHFSEAINESTAVIVGELLNVDNIIIGSVAETKKRITINTRLINVRTKEAEVEKHTYGENKKDLPNMCYRMALMINDSVYTESSPKKESEKTAIYAIGIGFPPSGMSMSEGKRTALEIAKRNSFSDTMLKLQRITLWGKPVSEIIENNPVAKEIFIVYMKDVVKNGTVEISDDGKTSIRLKILLHGNNGLFTMLNKFIDTNNTKSSSDTTAL